MLVSAWCASVSELKSSIEVDYLIHTHLVNCEKNLSELSKSPSQRLIKMIPNTCREIRLEYRLHKNFWPPIHKMSRVNGVACKLAKSF